MRTLQDIRLKENDRRAIERAVAILRNRFPVERVILFGSKARGDDDNESDIDLLVLTTRPITHADEDRMTEFLFQLQLDLGVMITPLVIAADEWEHGVYQAAPVRWEVERDGVAA